jgi:hypothetical protein
MDPASAQQLIASNTQFGGLNRFGATSMAGFLHSEPHLFLGGDQGQGDMSRMTAPLDPLFLLHHGNMDRIWAYWQDCHNYERIPQSQIGPPSFDTNGQFTLDSMMPGFSDRRFTARGLQKITHLGYLYADNSFIRNQAFRVCQFDLPFSALGGSASVNIGLKPSEVHVPEITKKVQLDSSLKEQLGILNSVFLSELDQSHNASLALARTVEVECQMFPARKPHPVDWVKMLGIQQYCEAGACDPPCANIVGVALSEDQFQVDLSGDSSEDSAQSDLSPYADLSN